MSESSGTSGESASAQSAATPDCASSAGSPGTAADEAARPSGSATYALLGAEGRNRDGTVAADDLPHAAAALHDEGALAHDESRPGINRERLTDEAGLGDRDQPRKRARADGVRLDEQIHETCPLAELDLGIVAERSDGNAADFAAAEDRGVASERRARPNAQVGRAAADGVAQRFGDGNQARGDRPTVLAENYDTVGGAHRVRVGSVHERGAESLGQRGPRRGVAQRQQGRLCLRQPGHGAKLAREVRFNELGGAPAQKINAHTP